MKHSIDQVIGGATLAPQAPELNDRDAKPLAPGANLMDALSDVLRVIRLSGGVFLEAHLTAPWCMKGRLSPEDCKAFKVAPQIVIASHYVVAGKMRLQVEGGEEIEVRAGELLLLPHNDLHAFGSDVNVPPFSQPDEVKAKAAGVFSRIELGGGGEATQLLCGYLGSDQPFGPLLSSLPKVLKVDMRATPSGAWVESSFRFAVSQIAAGRIGSTTVIAKLSELLFVEAVSHYIEELPADKKGWLGGLRDPQIGQALALMHAQPAKAWSAEELGAEVGMSRSGFAERFTSLIEQPPMQYLTYWRMQLAAQKLRESREAVAQVGYAVGYESEAAFSRAFKREFGIGPAEWRKKPGASPG
jgi:AraC-like DNA-binding protein/mannose-6-phosphate isomerase-like protein (cupin superfamily)